jgi:hypothetical protein
VIDPEKWAWVRLKEFSSSSMRMIVAKTEKRGSLYLSEVRSVRPMRDDNKWHGYVRWALNREVYADRQFQSLIAK